MTESLINVLLVDDHVLFREGLKALLSLQKEIFIVGEANNGLEAVEKARETLPDLILMDVRMPMMGGLQATQQIKKEMPSVRIVMLTASDEDQDLFGAIKSGAQGYVLKNTPSDELAKLLKGVFMGESPISGLIATKILAEFSDAQRGINNSTVESLTDREQEVLIKIGEGKSNKEISSELYVTESTVKKHVCNILGKLHLQNRVQAALYAVQTGLVHDEKAD
ncbi:MAG: response regulator transcription factor [Bacillota bacterium]|nr:response regulator transcription factor [Bacillota bacterium]